jgi:hypothetical protein
MPFAEGTPTVEITLGGKSYTLGWTWAAKRRVREYLTAKYPNPETADQQEQLATAFWAGLDKESRTGLSVEDVEEMIHSGNEAELVEKMGSLFTKSEPEPDPNVAPVAVMEKEKTPTTGRSTSTNSPQLASTT